MENWGEMRSTITVNEKIVDCIKKTAKLLISRPYVYGELIASLEKEMSVMERGKMFFETRAAVNDLISEGQVIAFKFTCDGSSIVKKLIVPADFKFIQ